jgi:RNA polymerase sigma factor (sigma-70 family)
MRSRAESACHLMCPPQQPAVSCPDGHQGFPVTQWSMVLAAAHDDGTGGEQALAKLYSAYRYPLYAFARRRGHSSHEAEDLTQEFFARLLQKDMLCSLKRDGGKFRSYLLATFKCFLANEWHKAHAQKRGGKQTVISLDEEQAEDRYRREPSHNVTPEKLFMRSWAFTVIDTAIRQLRVEYTAEGKAAIFEALHDRLIGAEDSEAYAELAARLTMQAGAVRMCVLRLRRRFGELLRAQVAATVDNPAEIEEELRFLIMNAC